MKELDSRLWGILDKVRGEKDIRDLKEIFISLIFLKYANDKYDPKANNLIEVSSDAHWSYLDINHLLSHNFGTYIAAALFSLEKENDKLKNTFSQFGFDSLIKEDSMTRVISSMYSSLSAINFTSYSYAFSELLDSLLINFAKNEGKHGVDYNTPDSISQLLIELLNPKHGSILDSACGTGGFFEKIKKYYPEGIFKFYGQEYDTSTLAFAKLRFAFNQADPITFGEAKSSLNEDQFPELKVDYVIMHPPFASRLRLDPHSVRDLRFEFGLPPKGNANFAWLQHAIFHLKINGKAVVLLNNSSLTSEGKEGQIRKEIVDADLVEAIISLPSKLLTNTSIPSCIWVLNKDKSQSEKVIFIDASNLGEMLNRSQRILTDRDINQIITQFYDCKENTFNSEFSQYSDIVGLDQIAKNEYLLTPSRYLNLDNITGFDLSKATPLKKIIKPVKLKKFDNEVFAKSISISDLSISPDAYTIDHDILSNDVVKPNHKLLPDNVLLIARIGNNIRPSYYSSSKIPVCCSDDIYVFKVETSIVLIDYLIAELHKDYVKAQLDIYKSGSSVNRISLSDFKNVLILLPDSLKEQKDIFEKEREIRFESITKDLGFEKEIDKLKQAQTKDLGSKRHNIMQHLNNVKASADVLAKMMELNGGILNSDEVIDPRRGVTVEKRFLRLQESLSKVIYYVDNITNDVNYDEAEIINPIKFVRECKERGIQNELFSVEIIVESSTFEGIEPLISISKNDFEEIYNNILENAINHGFVDKSKSYIFRISIAYIDDFLEINFVNNGKPFPKGIAEKFDVKGEKAGSTAGTGIGLWKVAEIAKHFNCNLEVFDEPESEFPVGFKLQFNLETL